VITVLFADLAGFTPRAERLDPEDVRAILTLYYGRLRTEIQAFGGTVEKFIGDAVMAVFGAPIAHGDDPERAVRAALAVRDAIAEMNDADPELDLQVRTAVNTGEALVALDASVGEGEGMVAGDVVNTAARLQTAAPVNGVLVGEETYRCTKSIIAYQDVDSVRAKGKQAPVPAWLALAAPAAPGERALGRVRMLGRHHELRILAGVWNQVVEQRRPHLVTVFGPPGIGKTRLATEFADVVVANGGRTIRGRSLPYGESAAYGAFAHLVKGICGIFDSDTARVACEKLERTVATLIESDDAGEVASHIAMLIGLGTEGGVDDRDTLFSSARRLVEALARRQPTVLLFEDIHWADESLLDLLELLAASARDVPLLLLTLARPDLHASRPSWGDSLPAYTALPLEALTEAGAQELAARLLHERSEDLDDGDEAAQLAETAGGNPLFIEELAASLSEGATAVGEVPTNIRGILLARLDALPHGQRALLLDASVVGKIFWQGALARLGCEPDALATLLNSLEERDLIRREATSSIEGDQQFAFKHMLIHDVAYATLPKVKRREGHAAVARFLEETAADRAEAAAGLGRHWREAGESERALDYFVAAAEQANRGWAKLEAVSLFDDALALLPEGDEERRRSIRLRRAVAVLAVYLGEGARVGGMRMAADRSSQ
jgi:class 3 adenylate cyclase